MTVAALSNRLEYTAAGGETTFPYPGPLSASDQLKVYQDESLLTYGVQYTLTGLGSSSGHVVLTTPASADDKFILLRQLPIDQNTDYVDADPFSAAAHEAALDKLTLIAQQLKEITDRCLQLNVARSFGKTGLELPVPGAASGRWIPAWNTLQTNLEAIQLTTETGLAGDVIPSSTQAGLPAPGTPGRLRRVTDSVDGLWRDTGADWRPMNRSWASVRDEAGVQADGTNASATTDGINAVLARAMNVVFEPGTYLIDQSLTLQSNQTVYLMPGATIKATLHRTGSAGTWTDTGLLQASGKTNVVICGGGTLDGDKATVGNKRIFGIRLDDCTHATIRDLKILNMPSSASIGTLGGDGIFISSTAVGGFGVQDDITIDNCYINNCTRQGISVVQGKRIKVTNCTITGTTGTDPGGGIDFEVDGAGDYIQDLIVSNCFFENNNQHIIFSTTGGSNPFHNATITGCVFRSARGGSSKGQIGAYQPNISIVGNTFYNDAGHAVNVRGFAFNTTLVGNTFIGNYDADERAMVEINDSDQTTVLGNVFANTGQSAIRIDANTLNNGHIVGVVIQGNAFYNCVTAGGGSAVIQILNESTSTYNIYHLLIHGNQIWDGRSAGDEADFGIQTSNASEAEQATWTIKDNLFTGVADPVSSAAGVAFLGRTWARSATLDFDLSAVTYQDLTITVTGARAGDRVSVSPPAAGTSGVIYYAWVSANDTVTVRAVTVTGTPNPASGTFTVYVTERLA